MGADAGVYTLRSEPEQRTITPFWVGFGILVIGVGLLSNWVVIGVGVLILFITLAVWMNGRWTEPEVVPVEGQRFSFMGVGTLIFIGSESVFFASLIAAAVHLRIHGDVLGQGPEILFPLVNTVVLFGSGVTAHYAQVAYRRSRRGGFFALLVLTVVLGAAFLGGQIWEYSNLPFGLTTDLRASIFYTLTGFHGMHVFCGLAVLVYLFFRARRELRVQPGERRPQEPTPGTGGLVDGGTYYWHFVDAVWVVVFVVVYLL
jgi:cytochrome c oxidase subunit 3